MTAEMTRSIDRWENEGGRIDDGPAALSTTTSGATTELVRRMNSLQLKETDNEKKSYCGKTPYGAGDRQFA